MPLPVRPRISSRPMYDPAELENSSGPPPTNPNQAGGGRIPSGPNTPNNTFPGAGSAQPQAGPQKEAPSAVTNETGAIAQWVPAGAREYEASIEAKRKSRGQQGQALIGSGPFNEARGF